MQFGGASVAFDSVKNRNNMAIKLGVSHQTPETLTKERLRYLVAMGVESMEIRGNSPYNGALFCVGTFGQMAGPVRRRNRT